MENKKRIITGLLVISGMLFVGCNNPTKADETKVKQTISSEQLSYRNTSLDDEKNTKVKASEFSKQAAGTSKRIKRAFQDAPPMIPHDTEGMLPITTDNNQCIACHVDTAPYDKTIPAVPESHMTNFRPVNSLALKGLNTSSEKLENVSIKKTNKLYQGRFNCSQCHAPQSNATLVTPNLFEADFKSKNGEFKSNWDANNYMDNINTLK